MTRSGKIDGDHWSTTVGRLRPGDRVDNQGDILQIVSTIPTGLRDGKLLVRFVDLETGQERELPWAKTTVLRLVSRLPKSDEQLATPKVVRGPQTKMPW